MSLRKKTLLIILTTLIVSIAVLAGISRIILLDSFFIVEQEDTRRNVERVLDALSKEITTLTRIGCDWAAWDDTYAFIADENERYIQVNLVDSTFKNLNLNIMLYINSDGRLVYGAGYDLNTGERVAVPESFRGHISENSFLLRHTGPESIIKGFVTLPEGPMFVVSLPIVTSEGEGPVRGSLIIGRYLDTKEIEYFSNLTHLSLVFAVNNNQIPPDFKEAFSYLTDKKVFVQPLNKDKVAGYTLLKDIYGNPALILRVDTPRDFFKEGQRSAHYFIFSLALICLAVLMVIMFLLEKFVISRLTRLIRNVGKIGLSKDLSARVSITGKDELYELAGEINGMLGALEQAQQKIQKSEEQYRRLFNEALTGNYISTLEGKIVLCNLAFARLFGFDTIEEVISASDVLLFPGEQGREDCLNLLRERKTLQFTEYDLRQKDGKQITVLQNITGIYNETGELIQLQGYILDVTERKRIEEQLKFLSLHDFVTGLYNRTYFEEEMKRLENGAFVPVGIIICDVDGLKFVNDTFGHDRGDVLLITAANIIKKSFHTSDVVARIGGDEFAVLLPCSPAGLVEKACQRIMEAIAVYNQTGPDFPLSISLGYALSNDKSVDIHELFKEADNNMYRQKLQNKQSSRSAVFQTLMKALEAKDFLTEGHTDRLHKLSTVLAIAARLPERRTITDLGLLAQFHDIGKVGVPDKILFKKGSLTPNETAEIQQHCEIGHRIAQSVLDLVPIADWILKHHEWWNGEGYPLGLKGEEIPLECRILAIVDAYDTMTSDRPYRKAMTREEALIELRKCAGTQFDPLLVEKFTELVIEGQI